MKRRILGIDLAVTAKHKATILDPATDETLANGHPFRTRLPDLDNLLSRAKADSDEEVELIAVLEATGMAWYPISRYLHEQGVKVYRVNGRKTKNLRQVHSPHARSDRIDSKVLAQLPLVDMDELIRWYPPCDGALGLQRLCREADRLRVEDVSIQNRLQSYHAWVWGGLRQVVPTVAQPWMLRHWYSPWQVQKEGVTKLRRAWADVSPEPLAQTEWVAGWVKRATEQTELYGSPQGMDADQLQEAVIRSLDRQAHCQAERLRLGKEEILPRYACLFPDAQLESIVGVGRISAATYMAFIQNIDRFPSVKAFGKWCGMVPRSNQSGNSNAKGLGITQAGPNIVKATLYLNAEVARQWDVQLAHIYYTQMVEYGKHHTQAVCACASHLANRIYAILTQKRPFELRDLDGKPISSQESRQMILNRFKVSEKVRQRTRKRQQD